MHTEKQRQQSGQCACLGSKSLIGEEEAGEVRKSGSRNRSLTHFKVEAASTMKSTVPYEDDTLACGHFSPKVTCCERL